MEKYDYNETAHNQSSEIATDGNQDYSDIEGSLDHSQVEEERVLDKVFNTHEEAYDFYNQYAFLNGFGIRVHNKHKRRFTNEIFRRQYVCNKQGFKNLKDKRRCGKELKRRRDTRAGCKAMFQISLKDDKKWVVNLFTDIHNHELTLTPSKVLKHRSHSKFHLSNACKNLVSEYHEFGLRPNQITKVVNITSQQCRNILSTERRNNIGKECHELIRYFQDKAAKDNTHYFVVGLDYRYFKNVFWADGRSRESYAPFGDVIVFDVTYKTNKFKMSFAPFVGVNHHRQTILLGATLLSDETEDSFIWVFQQFLSCMFDKSPVAIITDQDGTMKNTISRVFPNSRHRFCAWHINKHVMEHLQPLKALYDDFPETYSQWVKSQTIEEFENKWHALNLKYEIKDKSWLVYMYNLRKHWVKAFLKDTFFAGMTTSGRSESIHSFFDGYVNSNTMLNEFVVQYDKAVNSRRAAEEDEDFRTINTKDVLSSIHPIEIKVGECYTHNLFEIFKKE